MELMEAQVSYCWIWACLVWSFAWSNRISSSSTISCSFRCWTFSRKFTSSSHRSSALAFFQCASPSPPSFSSMAERLEASNGAHKWRKARREYVEYSEQSTKQSTDQSTSVSLPRRKHRNAIASDFSSRFFVSKGEDIDISGPCGERASKPDRDVRWRSRFRPSDDRDLGSIIDRDLDGGGGGRTNHSDTFASRRWRTMAHQ